MKIHTSLERFGEEMREIFELKVRTRSTATMADSGQAPAPPRLVLVGEGRRASWLSIGTGAGDRFALWWRREQLEGGKVAGGVQSGEERE